MRPCRGVHSEPDRGSCCCRPRRSCREGQLQATCGLSPPPPRSPHTGCCQSASADRQPGRTCCAPPHAHPFSSPSGETKRGLLSRRETRDMWELAGEACGPGRSPGQPGPRGLLGRLGGAAWSGPWAHRQNGGGGWQAQPAPLGCAGSLPSPDQPRGILGPGSPGCGGSLSPPWVQDFWVGAGQSALAPGGLSPSPPSDRGFLVYLSCACWGLP